MAIAQTGTLISSTHRQLSASVRLPPTNGPTAVAAAASP